MDKNPIKHGSLKAAGLKFETGQSDGSATDEARQGQIRRNCLSAKGTTAQSLRNWVGFAEGKEKLLVNEEGKKPGT
jgi:hypothetical protein